jgi:uncharacterized membrane protein
VRNFLLWLHIASAILIIGGLTFMSMMLPGLVREGVTNVPVLRRLHQFSKVFGASAAVVLVLGLLLVFAGRNSFHYNFDQIWLGLSLLLFIVFGVIASVPAAKSTEAALAKLESGQSADDEAKRLSMLGGINILILLAILWLMVAKPGY